MTRGLADTQAIALLVGRSPATIRSWAHRYPHRMPRRGTGSRNRALYAIADAEDTAAWLASFETSVTMCNTEAAGEVRPETGGRP